MIRVKFKPNYDSYMKFDYHNDDEVWKGNKPLRTHKTWNGIGVLEKDGKTLQDLIRYDFNFGRCILYKDNQTGELKILNCDINICDGWNLHICMPLGGNKYGIFLDRLTHETCIKYNMHENKIRVYKAGRADPAPWGIPNTEQVELLSNIINMKVDDCYIWTIIQKVLLDNFTIEERWKGAVNEKTKNRK